MSLFDKFHKKKSSTPKTILVIDDDVTTLRIVEQALMDAGYQVLTAQDGEQGLKITQENDPDVIITDVLMPGMDGFMLFRELKRDEETKNKSVLVLTSRENVGDTFRRFGADSFLTKPVDSKRLLSEIEKILEK